LEKFLYNTLIWPTLKETINAIVINNTNMIRSSSGKNHYMYEKDFVYGCAFGWIADVPTNPPFIHSEESSSYGLTSSIPFAAF
jgi:hypothetical protein